VLSFFKRKEEPPSELTFKTRVEQFWRWFAGSAPRIYKVIEDKQAQTLAPEMSAKVDELMPRMAWVFGPGENGARYSLTLTGEGVIHKQLLAEFWLQQAPKIEGWSFYSSRQASLNAKGWNIDIGGNKFDPLEFWLTPHLENDREKVGITVWHPLFASLSDNDRFGILFLVLDEFLGEFGTQNWIGEIAFSDKKLAESMPVAELPAYIKTVEAQTGWKKFSPMDTWVSYTLPKQQLRFRRDDVIAGSSCNITLLNEFLRSGDCLEDPLRGSGAEYVFVQFDRARLPRGEEVAARGKIEDALIDKLKEKRSGRFLGGAMGTQFAYIDLMLFDGATSASIVRDVLRRHEMPKATTIEYFATNKKRAPVII
jgi:hypothetical protein